VTTAVVTGLIVGSLAIIVLIGLTVPRPATGQDATDNATGGVARGAGSSAGHGAAPAALTLAVPPGYGRTPVWSTPIAGWTRNVATDDGTVLTRDQAGHVLLLAPADGHRLWTSREVTTTEELGPWPATVDGARVAAVAGPGRLTYWRLPSSRPSPATPPGSPAGGGSAQAVQPAPGAGAAVTVPLPAGATVNWAGASPLIELPNRTVAVIRSGALVQVPLPVGARGLAADGKGVLAATATTWLRQPAAQPPVAPRPLPRPGKAGASPVRVEAVGTSLLLAVWPEGNATGQVVALMDTTSGANVVQTVVTAAADLRKFGIVREIGGTQLAIGPVTVDTYAAKVDLLDLRYVVKTLTRGHAWTMFSGRATDLHLTPKGDFTTVPFGPGEPALPIGVSRLNGDETRAVVVAAAGSGWLLCGLGAA
jgi:hypothetical protein